MNYIKQIWGKYKHYISILLATNAVLFTMIVFVSIYVYIWDISLLSVIIVSTVPFVFAIFVFRYLGYSYQKIYRYIDKHIVAVQYSLIMPMLFIFGIAKFFPFFWLVVADIVPVWVLDINIIESILYIMLLYIYVYLTSLYILLVNIYRFQFRFGSIWHILFSLLIVSYLTLVALVLLTWPAG